MTVSAPRYSRLIICLLALAAILAFHVFLQTNQTKINLAGILLAVDVSDTETLRRKGLSGRNGLPENSGMLFVFERPSNACMWMKDMKFNIDILWFDKQKKLVAYERNISPKTFPKNFCPPALASYVLEVPAGFTNHINLELGKTEFKKL